MPYNCYYHPNLPAVAVCGRCGRSICASCNKPYVELSLCPTCYHAHVPAQMPAAAPPPMMAAPPMSMPNGGMIYGPFPRPWFWGPGFFYFNLLLLVIAAGLIAANAGALLFTSFFLWWSALFPWVANLGSFAFILGIVLALVLMGAFILYFLRYRVLAAFVAFPAAIVSLFIGGGFILGMVIGILAGLFILLFERRRGFI